MAEKVTLKEIARAAGVSVTSVSLVLNNRPNRVSAEARDRIKKTARAMHYVPNQIARSLVMRRSRTLGLIVPNIESRFFSSLARNIELRCRNRGYALFIMNSGGESAVDVELVQLLLNRGVDGLLLVASDEVDPPRELVEELTQAPVPYVLVDRAINELSCDKVRFDSELGGYLATRHLLERGHRRIACMVNLRSNTGIERRAGYERALREAGVELDPSLEFQTEYYISEAYEVAGRVLTTDATAIFASSDNIALGTLKRIFDAGLRVPDDYSLVSYDNSAADALFEPALTAIEQNVGELSDAALGRLFARVEEKTMPPEEVLLPPRLVIKDSVRPISQP